MKGKIIGFSLLICLVVAMFALPGNTYAATKFSDVSGHWAEKYINEAVAQGIVKGYPDGKFLPDNPVTRAEFATIVNKALGNTGTTTINFKDVPRIEWYYNEIAKAVAATYVAGYDDNTYKPNNSITRQEAAVMISRFVPTYGHSGRITSFNDYRNIDEWAYAALQKVNGKGYIGGYTDGGIHPQDKLTRAQAAKIICDILDEETIVKTATTVKNDGTKLSGKIYSNNVVMHKDLDDDSATIDNAIILGTLTIEGGGTETITINNSRVSNVVVDKDDSAVRVLAKGETAISSLTASEESILQTTGLAGGFYGSGFNNIILKGSAVSTLKGSFPLVNVDGTSATLNLESGTISELKVTSSGRRSTINASSGTTISNATVGSEAYFRGTGTISHMAVNSNGITYETKPKNWTIASKLETPSQVDPALEIVFSPKHAATKVSLDTKITLTFSSAVKLYDGTAIKAADIPDFITLRRSSSSGTSVKFTATIDSAKKVITITPSENLDETTRYYVILDKNSLKDAKGNGNAAQSIYFNTGDANAGTTFSPRDGATGVALKPSITVKFDDKVIRYSGSTAVDDSYAAGCVTFKQGSSNVAFTASINSSKNTITITPTKDLDLNKNYTVAVVANKLKTSGGTAIPAASATWSTGYTAPVLSEFTLVPGDINIVAKMKPNVAGKIYAVVVPAGSAAPSATQIAAGQNAGGFATPAAKNESAAAGTLITLPAMGASKPEDKLASGTSYDVYAVLQAKDSGAYSTVLKLNTTTTYPKIYLSSLTVGPVGGGNYIAQFNSMTDTYDISIPSNVSKVSIAASSSEGGIITIGGTSVGSAGSKEVDVNGKVTVQVVVKLANRGDTTYTLNLNQMQNSGLEFIKINAAPVSSVGGTFYSYALSTNEATSLSLDINTIDEYAFIGKPKSDIPISGPDNVMRTGQYTLAIPAGDTTVAITFTVSSGPGTPTTYTINISRPALPATPDSGSEGSAGL